MINSLLEGFGAILSSGTWLFLLGGVLLGVVMGCIPGLTGMMAIALIIPLTFYMDPVKSLALLLGIYNGGTYGGSISAIMLGTPGTPQAAATVFDGFPMAKKGQAGKALKMALIASVHGCLISSIILLLAAEPVARLSLKFGPGEYTVLMVFAMTMIGAVSGKSFVKGIIGAVLGVLISTIGLDLLASTPRYTFGNTNLISGIQLTPMLIGLLAMSEILSQIEETAKLKRLGMKDTHLPPPTCKEDSTVSLKEYFRCLPAISLSSLLGVLIGALPALGATIASFLGYDVSKKLSKHPEEFGKGSIEGVAGPEAGNNGVCGASLIPLLAFGIPGDAVAAVLLGALMIQGISTGPLIFTESPKVVYSMYASLISSNVLMLVTMWFLLPLFTKLAKVPKSVIYPVVVAMCLIGVYSINQNSFDILTMVLFSVLGYLMSKFGFPPSTLVIGFILGPQLEKNFRQALLISGGDPKIFINSPLCLILWAAAVVSIVTILLSKRNTKSYIHLAEE